MLYRLKIIVYNKLDFFVLIAPQNGANAKQASFGSF